MLPTRRSHEAIAVPSGDYRMEIVIKSLDAYLFRLVFWIIESFAVLLPCTGVV